MAIPNQFADLANNPAVLEKIQAGINSVMDPCIINLDHIYAIITLYRENIGTHEGINKYSRDILLAKSKRDPQTKKNFSLPHTMGFYQIFCAYRERILSEDDSDNLAWLQEDDVQITYGKKGSEIPLSDLYNKFTDGEHDDQMIKLEILLFKIFLNAVRTKLSLNNYKAIPAVRNGNKVIKGKTIETQIKEDREAEQILKEKAEVTGDDATTSDETNMIAALARKVKNRVVESGMRDGGEITLDTVANHIFPLAMDMMRDQNVQQSISGIVSGIAKNGFDPQNILKQVHDTVKNVDQQETESKELHVEDEDDDESINDEDDDDDE